MKSKKAALQLPISMLVVLILAVVIFTSGVFLLYTIYGKSVEFQEKTEEQLDKQIEAVLCDKPVCLATTYKKIFRGKDTIIGLRIYNNLQYESEFTITSNLNKAFDKSNDEIANPENYVNVYPEKMRVDGLGSKQEKNKGIGIEVAKNAPSGTYVINIKVETAPDQIYGSPQQLRVEVP
jgi:hypothetical protein